VKLHKHYIYFVYRNSLLI